MRGTASRSAAAVAAVAVPLVLVAGLVMSCTASTPPKPLASAPVPKATPVASTDVQKCGECMKKGMAPKVVGASVTSGSVQVVKVNLTNGYYEPNQFTVKAGQPVQAVFTGKAVGCLAYPTFKSLGKSGNLTGGSAILDLGTLKPGTYAFTCKMGMNAGTIVVK